MIVCICNRITDTQIKETIRERHCRTVIELHNLLGVCINCCKCRETIEGILDDERQVRIEVSSKIEFD
jgi:bacterioferritin-associated ferredoxin